MWLDRKILKFLGWIDDITAGLNQLFESKPKQRGKRNGKVSR